jgi:hypothetical protein
MHADEHEQLDGSAGALRQVLGGGIDIQAGTCNMREGAWD